MSSVPEAAATPAAWQSVEDAQKYFALNAGGEPFDYYYKKPSTRKIAEALGVVADFERVAALADDMGPFVNALADRAKRRITARGRAFEDLDELESGVALPANGNGADHVLPQDPPPHEFPPEAKAAPERSAATAERKPVPIDWNEAATREPPARSWAIRGWLGFGHTTLLVGSGGIGKTLLAQQMASYLALGRSFIDEVPRALRVLMWACEDDGAPEDYELERRGHDIARSMGVGVEAFAENLLIIPRHGCDNVLVTTDYGRVAFLPRLEELREQAEEFGADVVILDNAAQLFGVNENDRHAVTAALNGVGGALRGRAVLLLAHPARSTGSEFSGSGAWENVARTRLFLGDRLPDQDKPRAGDEPTDDVRILARRKGNYAAKDIRHFTYKNGVFVPDEIDEGAGMVGHIRKGRVVQTLIAAARRLEGLGIRVSDGATSPQFLPRMVLEYKLGEGATKRELADAMREALLDGKLRREVVGKYSNRAPMEGLKVTE